MRETLKNNLPEPVVNLIKESRDGLQRAAAWPSAAFHPWRQESIARLKSLKNIHAGKRCFIIGNGPSLNQTDLTKLRDEYTFGMNRIYMAFPDWGFTTSYLVAINSLVIEQCAADYRSLNIPKFFSWRSHKQLYPTGVPDSLTHFLHTTYTGPKFAQTAHGRLWEGATVTFVCLQLAFHMGFEQAILIGVDHSFATQGKPNTTVVSQGDDPNHFHANYFGKGFRWQLPDLDTSEVGYYLAKEAYLAAGRQVADATIGGKLTVFPKANYDSLF